MQPYPHFLSSPNSSGRHIVFGLDSPGKAWHSGWHEVERGEDLLVLLPHIHHHPRLRGRQHLPSLAPLLPGLVAKDGDARRDRGLGRRGGERQGRSCRRCRWRWTRRSWRVQHWCSRQVHHGIKLAPLLRQTIFAIKLGIFIPRCDNFSTIFWGQSDSVMFAPFYTSSYIKQT